MTKSSLLRSDSERKFTPPTKFPAEYVNGRGTKVIIYAKGHGSWPLVGQDVHGIAASYNEKGAYGGGASFDDLHDIPKRITTWHNVYCGANVAGKCRSRQDADLYGVSGRLCVYRIERDEDGGNPEIFVEKAEDFKEEV